MLFLKGKPLDIPDECVINIAPMAIGDQFTCAALSVPENVKMVTDPDTVIVIDYETRREGSKNRRKKRWEKTRNKPPVANCTKNR